MIRLDKKEELSYDLYYLLESDIDILDRYDNFNKLLSENEEMIFKNYLENYDYIGDYDEHGEFSRGLHDESFDVSDIIKFYKEGDELRMYDLMALSVVPWFCRRGDLDGDMDCYDYTYAEIKELLIEMHKEKKGE